MPSPKAPEEEGVEEEGLVEAAGVVEAAGLVGVVGAAGLVEGLAPGCRCSSVLFVCPSCLILLAP